MSEISTPNQGPLDVVRRISWEAEELDQLIQTKITDDPEVRDKLQEQLLELEARHPLKGQEVIVYGEQLHDFTHKVIERMRPEALPHQNQTGTYLGMEFCEAIDGETEAITPRVVHKVRIGSSDPERDALGNYHQVHYMNYILATGAEVVPTQPINAHSLRDLSGDTMTAEIDRLVLDEDSDKLRKLQALGSLTNRALRKHEWDETDIGQQRVSYINSLGFLRGISVVTKDLILCDRKTYETGQELQFSDGVMNFTAYPERFEVTLGYERRQPGNVPLLGGPPELFFTGNLPSGETILAPLKNIAAVKQA